MQPDDIDLQILRMQHGWSSARVWINGLSREFMLTHIFDDPLAALTESALKLEPTVELVSFDWHDEPGCYRWTFARVPQQHNLFSVTVSDYRSYQPKEGETPVESLNFTTEYRFWKALVSAEVATTQRLLKFTPYRVERRPDTFPHRALRALELQLTESTTPLPSES